MSSLTQQLNSPYLQQTAPMYHAIAVLTMNASREYENRIFMSVLDSFQRVQVIILDGVY